MPAIIGTCKTVSVEHVNSGDGHELIHTNLHPSIRKLAPSGLWVGRRELLQA